MQCINIRFITTNGFFDPKAFITKPNREGWRQFNQTDQTCAVYVAGNKKGETKSAYIVVVCTGLSTIAAATNNV